MEESNASKRDYNNMSDIEKTIEKDLDDPLYILTSVFADIYVDFGREILICR